MNLIKYKSIGGKLETVQNMPRDSWLHVVDPDLDKLHALGEELSVPRRFLDAALDVDEVARFERQGEVTLLTIRVPNAFDIEDSRTPYKTVNFAMIITPIHLLTICHFDTGLVSDVIEERGDQIDTSEENRIVLHILSVTAQRYLTYLRYINEAVERVENRAERSLKNAEVMELMRFQRSLTYFMTGLRSNQILLEHLEEVELFQLFPGDMEMLREVATENRQAAETSRISSEILMQVMNAYASVISNNLNDVMKRLAALTIIFAVPTVIAGVYGMNVALPWADVEVAFHWVMGLMIGVAALLTLALWKLDWL